MLLDLLPAFTSGATPAVRFTDPFDPPNPGLLVAGAPSMGAFDAPSPTLEVQ